jgi:hypothetical protein
MEGREGCRQGRWVGSLDGAVAWPGSWAVEHALCFVQGGSPPLWCILALFPSLTGSWRCLPPPAVHQAESMPDSHSLHITLSANQQRSWAGEHQPCSTSARLPLLLLQRVALHYISPASSRVLLRLLPPSAAPSSALLLLPSHCCHLWLCRPPPSLFRSHPRSLLGASSARGPALGCTVDARAAPHTAA